MRLELGSVPSFPEVDPGAALLPLPSSGTDGQAGDNGLGFAADATLADLDGETIACWAEILHRVPKASLLLRDRCSNDPETVAELIGRFGNFGIADRVQIVGAPAAEALYADADVALLPLTCPRPETVVAVLQAALPLVCPAGDARHRRFAGSVLHHLELGTETIASSAQAYADLASHWARDAALRHDFRRHLGERIGRGRAMDPKARARDMEAAFERMWQQTCAVQN
jgi:predicted O-linked N-acetylglucosamine transferase (SPINDLY family)